MSINGKKCSKGDRKTITVDITDFYDDLKKCASDDIRTIEEEIRYFIKKGLGKFTYNFVTYTYPSNSDINCTKGSYKDQSLVYNGDSATMIPINESASTTV